MHRTTVWGWAIYLWIVLFFVAAGPGAIIALYLCGPLVLLIIIVAAVLFGVIRRRWRQVNDSLRAVFWCGLALATLFGIANHYSFGFGGYIFTTFLACPFAGLFLFASAELIGGPGAFRLHGRRT